MAKVRRQAGDFLDEIIAARAARDPEFPKRVASALRRRELLRRLARARQRSQLSQGDVASRMNTSQPAIAKIESGEVDLRTSTLERYAAALGGRIEYRFVPAPRGRGAHARADA